MSLVPYAKPYLAPADQLELLKSRGMTVTDEPLAIKYLEKIGYYRLSGYWHSLRNVELYQDEEGRARSRFIDTFKNGVEFRHAIELYVFDKRLRMLILDAIERVEVALRVDIALLLGARGAWAHRNTRELNGRFTQIDPSTGTSDYQDWINRLDDHESRSKDEFAKHFKGKYSSPLPIWIAIELWDFGMMSKFFGGMLISDQDHIAAKYNVPRRDMFGSWLRSINHIRNICAHHARLWNISPVDQIKPPRTGQISDLDHLANDSFALYRVYASVAVIQYLLKHINPSSHWPDRLKHHFGTFPEVPGANVEQSGFPSGWDKLPLWT